MIEHICRRLFFILGKDVLIQTPVGRLPIYSFEKISVEDVKVGDFTSIRSTDYDANKEYDKRFLEMTLNKVVERNENYGLLCPKIELVTSSNDVFTFWKTQGMWTSSSNYIIFKPLMLYNVVS